MAFQSPFPSWKKGGEGEGCRFCSPEKGEGRQRLRETEKGEEEEGEGGKRRWWGEVLAYTTTAAKNKPMRPPVANNVLAKAAAWGEEGEGGRRKWCVKIGH